MAKRKIKRILSYSERRRKIRRKRLMRVFFFLILLLCLFGGAVYCIRLPYFRINDVQVAGAADHKKEEIKSAIEEGLQGNKYLFIPNDQILFHSNKHLAESLQNRFSYILNLSVKKNYPRSIAVSVDERTPVALYCQTDCYFVDSSGFIYSAASSFSTGVYTVYEDQTRAASSSPLHTFLMDSNTLKQLQNYNGELQKLGINPAKITFIASREIRIDNENNGYILINLEKPSEETIQNLRTVFLQGITKFEYIDVRYGNKIFYKDLK